MQPHSFEAWRITVSWALNLKRIRTLRTIWIMQPNSFEAWRVIDRWVLNVQEQHRIRAILNYATTSFFGLTGSWPLSLELRVSTLCRWKGSNVTHESFLMSWNYAATMSAWAARCIGNLWWSVPASTICRDNFAGMYSHLNLTLCSNAAPQSAQSAGTICRDNFAGMYSHLQSLKKRVMW